MLEFNHQIHNTAIKNSRTFINNIQIVYLYENNMLRMFKIVKRGRIKKVSIINRKE